MNQSNAYQLWKPWGGLIIAVCYGVTSTLITFFNKAVFSYNFDGSNSLTLAQGIFSILFLLVLKRFRMLEFHDFSVGTAKSLSPLAAAFCGMVITGLAALKFVNVPMYSALRRFTTFIVIVAEFLLLGKRVPKDEFNSVVLMVVGAMIAGWGDLTFDMYGYLLTVLNCVVTAVYLVLIAKKSKETGLNTVGLMFYNNLLSLPFLVGLVVVTEWDTLANFDGWSSVGFHFFFWMSAILAFALNYFVFLCSTVNSPLTTSITGQLKSIFQTVLGLFTFGGVVITFSLAVGLLISTVGGVWYGVIKYRAQVSKVQKEDSDLERADNKK